LLTVNPEITGGGSETTIATDAEFCGLGFGFSVVELTVAVFEMPVPFGAAHTTIRFNVNCTELPFVSALAVQVTWPVPPTAGVVHVHPEGAATD
jgi:hypothetical protein